MTKITDKEVAAWLMRKDTSVYESFTDWAAYWHGSMFRYRAASKFAAVRKAIRAERKAKGKK